MNGDTMRRAGTPSSTPAAGTAVIVPVPARTFHLTDAGNAEFFAARHGCDVRFDHRRRRFLLWRGHNWQPDTDAEIRRLAKGAMRQRLRDATVIEDPDRREKAVTWALGSATTRVASGAGCA
jgi:D5-like protein